MIIHDSNKCFDDNFRKQENWLGSITFEGDDLASRLLDKYCQTEPNNMDILEILHSFNKNIIQVDVKAHSYKVFFDGEIITLNFRNLSSAEKLFVVCHMASQLKETIIVSDRISSLTISNLYRFIETYKDNEYIEVAPPSNTLEYNIRRLMERVGA